MSDSPAILALAGSTRSGSYNKRLRVIAADALRDAGASVTEIDLRDYPLPLYDGDLEVSSGVPEKAIELKSLFRTHQGFLMVCPEYNASISGVWKNAMDWVSRPWQGNSGRYWFAGRAAALMSASPGGFGGVRGLAHARAVLTTLGTEVLADQVSVPRAGEAFDENGNLNSGDMHSRVGIVAARLVGVTRALQSV